MSNIKFMGVGKTSYVFDQTFDSLNSVNISFRIEYKSKVKMFLSKSNLWTSTSKNVKTFKLLWECGTALLINKAHFTSS